MANNRDRMSNSEALADEYRNLGEVDALLQRMSAMIEGFMGAQRQGDECESTSYGAEWARAMQWLAVKEIIGDAKALMVLAEYEGIIE